MIHPRHASKAKQGPRSQSWIGLLVCLTIVSAYLITAYLVGFLAYTAFLLCPLLHLLIYAKRS